MVVDFMKLSLWTMFPTTSRSVCDPVPGR